ncbi:MAG: N-(5'-phosphoribosyl)anthranilate isomerase [Actinobacteria bacterium]|nr:N-(5'-phosphoribosyl)anthranilate isomerase [Actinomycetota bacterium]NIU69370.1 N-(5'-phosphoribosyl)anthranilate isomerase [Actinomycetota bacterium]NIV57799.1 N-(5'-phosphoribosyl)anthranilate isomerase [Actinomycetota bacterium]NIV89330.1 N-(5'-phosphoribosyl)anthranilate isomerase [Actinomycetota bacterium]NIW31235.1 N-(5'-phosphoribosyl)anthranilate isomerase [Actinomycetota bacterium]
MCGLTRPEDVAVAVDAGADAVGFVSHPGSPRYVSLPAIAELIVDVPVLTVVLTVELGPAAALTAVEVTGALGIQPYGARAGDVAEAALAAGIAVLYPVSRPAEISAAPLGATPLCDTPDEIMYGGTGRVFDWSTLRGIEQDFILAGGLGPDNVTDAIRRVRPWGVDASSRLEAAAGVKDPGKVAAFVQEAKSA